MYLWKGPSRMHWTTCCSIPEVNKWECDLVLLWNKVNRVKNWISDWTLTRNGFKQAETIFWGFPPNFHFQVTLSSALPFKRSSQNRLIFYLYLHTLYEVGFGQCSGIFDLIYWYFKGPTAKNTAAKNHANFFIKKII